MSRPFDPEPQRGRVQRVCKQTTARIFVAVVACCALSSALAPRVHADGVVYIGGGDEHLGAFDGYLGDPAGWTWVRAHADGYYINTFPIKNDPNDTKQNANLSGMAKLFTHKNVFYETELDGNSHNISDADDVARMANLEANGFKVTLTTCNEGIDASRLSALRTGDPNRPVFAMGGPWTIDGDIHSAKAANWRSWIMMSDGSATDSPLALWETDGNMCHEASYSTVKYAHMLGKRAMIMMCPHKLMTDANWFKQGKAYIQNHEDNDAIPDIWAISYYAAYLEAHAVTPEQVNGVPAETITGLGYYLIHHLRDPDHVAHWAVSVAAGVAVRADGATIDAVGDKSASIELANSSSWLDLIPVIHAEVKDPSNAWQVSYKLDSQDVTAELKAASGLTLYKARRFAAGANKQITVSRVLRSGADPSAALDVTLSLSAHPSEPAVLSTLHLRFRDPKLASDADGGVAVGTGNHPGVDAGMTTHAASDAAVGDAAAAPSGSGSGSGSGSDASLSSPPRHQSSCACSVAPGARLARGQLTALFGLLLVLLCLGLRRRALA